MSVTRHVNTGDIARHLLAHFVGAVTTIADGIAGGLYPHRPPEDDGWGGYLPCAYCDPDGLGAAEPGRNIVYLTADHFMYHFITAVQRQSAMMLSVAP